MLLGENDVTKALELALVPQRHCIGGRNLVQIFSQMPSQATALNLRRDGDQDGEGNSDGIGNWWWE